jgi:hypothetical protein
MVAPSLAFLSIFSPKMMAQAMMTMTRLAVFITDEVTGPTSARNWRWGWVGRSTKSKERGRERERTRAREREMGRSTKSKVASAAAKPGQYFTHTEPKEETWCRNSCGSDPVLRV